MTSSARFVEASPEIVRVSGPQGLVASIPFLLGFQPAESIVLLCMRGPRHRIGPVLRMDIPATPSAWRATAHYLAAQAKMHASSVAVVCYTRELNERRRHRVLYPYTSLVGMCVDEVRASGVTVFDAMLVRDGLVWSYLRHHPATEGYPLPDRTDPSMNHLQAAQAFMGRAVLPDREELAAGVAGPGPEAASAATQALEAASGRLTAYCVESMNRGGTEPESDFARRALQLLFDGHRQQQVLDVASCADLVCALSSAATRDCVISWVVARSSDDPVPMLVELARWVPDPVSAQTCCVLAIAAYRDGQGALAHVALDRALSAEPTHLLASMLVELFSSGVLPESLDRLITGTQPHATLRAVRDPEQ